MVIRILQAFLLKMKDDISKISEFMIGFLNLQRSKKLQETLMNLWASSKNMIICLNFTLNRIQSIHLKQIT